MQGKLYSNWIKLCAWQEKCPTQWLGRIPACPASKQTCTDIVSWLYRLQFHISCGMVSLSCFAKPIVTAFYRPFSRRYMKNQWNRSFFEQRLFQRNVCNPALLELAVCQRQAIFERLEAKKIWTILPSQKQSGRRNSADLIHFICLPETCILKYCYQWWPCSNNIEPTKSMKFKGIWKRYFALSHICVFDLLPFRLMLPSWQLKNRNDRQKFIWHAKNRLS